MGKYLASLNAILNIDFFGHVKSFQFFLLHLIQILDGETTLTPYDGMICIYIIDPIWENMQ